LMIYLLKLNIKLRLQVKNRVSKVNHQVIFFYNLYLRTNIGRYGIGAKRPGAGRERWRETIN